VDAHGVHLGNDDLPVAPVKQQWPGLTVGRTHRAEDDLIERADYLGIGPVFSSFSKPLDVEPCGWEGVRQVIDRTSTDVYGIGGIDQTRLEGVPEGLTGICVLGAVWESEDPIEALRDLRSVLP